MLDICWPAPKLSDQFIESIFFLRAGAWVTSHVMRERTAGVAESRPQRTPTRTHCITRFAYTFPTCASSLRVKVKWERYTGKCMIHFVCFLVHRKFTPYEFNQFVMNGPKNYFLLCIVSSLWLIKKVLSEKWGKGRIFTLAFNMRLMCSNLPEGRQLMTPNTNGYPISQKPMLWRHL